MSWLRRHIEELSDTSPYVDQLSPFRLASNMTEFIKIEPSYFEPNEMAMLKNIWRSVKIVAKNQPLLLPGRDVFIFEILARRENYPTLFMPEISRAVVRDFKTNLSNYFIFDTGFIGSIPRALNVDSFKLLSYTHNRQSKEHGKQLYPNMGGSRGFALKIEKTPKYWQTAHIDTDGKIRQDWNSWEEFCKALILTIQIYTDSTPSYVPYVRCITKGSRPKCDDMFDT